MFRDLAYAFRSLRRQPAAGLVAILTLAIGIGTNISVFGVADALLWKPLPYPQPDRLVVVFERRDGERTGAIPASPGNYFDWKQRQQVFEQLSMYRPGSANLAPGAGNPEAVRVDLSLVDRDFFETLRVKPLHGRLFSATEWEPGRDRVLILSHRLWQDRFGGSLEAFGREVSLDGRAHIIVGVMPEGFQYPRGTELWVPLVLPPALKSARPATLLFPFARLRPGVRAAQAHLEMNRLAEQLEAENPRSNQGWRVSVESMHDYLNGGLARKYSWMLWTMAGLLLLISCANVANLQLAPSAARRWDLSVRAALGASRSRLIRELLAQSFAIALCGGAAGALISVWGLDVLRSSVPAWFAREVTGWSNIQVDSRVLLYAALLTIVCGLLAGLFPAIAMSRDPVREGLPQASRALVRGRGLRARAATVSVQMALAMILLVGAGLMVKGLAGMLSRENTIEPDRLLTLRIGLPQSSYATPQSLRGFEQRLLEEISALPGVESAAVASSIPHSVIAAAIRFFSREGIPPDHFAERTLCQLHVVSAGFMKTIRIPLIAGRDFRDSDTSDAPRVAIISRRMANQFFPGEDPLGKRVTIGSADAAASWFTIVGIAGDIVHQLLDRQPRAALYVPGAQMPQRSLHLLVRTRTGASALAAAASQTIAAMAPDLPPYHVKTMRQLILDELIGLRFVAALILLFGALSLVLACIGVYGVVSSGVSERTREIGLRLALGAERRQVFGMVLREGFLLTAAGMLFGIGLAYALATLLAGAIYGVEPGDPLVFLTAPLPLLISALAATLFPALRASAVDPADALRRD